MIFQAIFPDTQSSRQGLFVAVNRYVQIICLDFTVSSADYIFWASPYSCKTLGELTLSSDSLI